MLVFDSVINYLSFENQKELVLKLVLLVNR